MDLASPGVVLSVLVVLGTTVLALIMKSTSVQPNVPHAVPPNAPEAPQRQTDRQPPPSRRPVGPAVSVTVRLADGGNKIVSMSPNATIQELKETVRRGGFRANSALNFGCVSSADTNAFAGVSN